MIQFITSGIRSKKRRTVAISGLALLCIFLLQSCYKDLSIETDDLGWKPSIAVPLLNGELSFADVLIDPSQGTVSTNKSGYLSLYYNTSSEAPFNGGFVLSTLIASPLIETDKQFKVKPADNGTFSSGGSVSYPTDTIEFQFTQNEIMDTLEFKNGSFTISAASNFLSGVIATITIPKFKDANGASYSTVINLAGGESKDVSIGLNGYTADLKTPGVINSLPVTVSVKSAVNGQVPRAGDKIDLAYKFTNFVFSYAKGNITFPPFTIPEDSTVIDALQNISNAEIAIEDPRINIIVRNSFGITIPAKFTTFNAVLADGSTLPILKSNQPDSFAVKPSLMKGQLRVDTALKLNNTTSNLDQILVKNPKKLVYGFASKTYGPKPVGFVQDTSHLYINTNLELPLNIALRNLAFEQVFGSVFKDIPSTESAIVQINTENDFPIGVKLQVYFLSQDSTKIDSLNTTNQDIIGAGTRINNVQTATKKTLKLALTSAQLDKLKALCKSIRIKAVAQTPGNYPTDKVKFYADQKIKINMGILAKHVDGSSLGKK